MASSMDGSDSDCFSELNSTLYQLSIYSDSDSDTESIVSIEQRLWKTHITDETPILDVKLPKKKKTVKQLPSLSAVCDQMPYKSEIVCNYFLGVDPKLNYGAIEQGINFRSICKNKKCKSNGEYVLVNFGMCEESNQVCNLAEYLYETQCPRCHSQILPDIICAVFKDCAVKIKYKMCSEKRPREIRMSTEKDNYLYVDIIDGVDKYNYIQFTLSKE